MSKCFVNHYFCNGSAPFSSLQNAREAAVAYIKYQAEVKGLMHQFVDIIDSYDNYIELVNVDTVYGADFNESEFTLTAYSF